MRMQRPGGRSNWLNMAGCERYVQSASLKSFGLSRDRFSTPAFGPSPMMEEFFPKVEEIVRRP